MAAAKTLSPQVATAFVKEYYRILSFKPDQLYNFYEDRSKLGRPEEDGSMSITTTLDAINKKIVSLNYSIYVPLMRSVDVHESFRGGLEVLVIGSMHWGDFTIRNFAQTFFLAPQDNDRGYFVLNDLFRYVKTGTRKPESKVVKLGDLLGHAVTQVKAWFCGSEPRNQEPVDQSSTEALDVYAINVEGMPANANCAVLFDEFKEFGHIKNVVLQFGGRLDRKKKKKKRSRGSSGFCSGIVEFEVASAVQKALEAPPVSIGGCQVEVKPVSIGGRQVEVKMSPNSQKVAKDFVEEYYNILHKNPDQVDKFYEDASRLCREEEDGSMSISKTIDAISKKIVSLNSADLKIVPKYVDAQESLEGGVHVLVTGRLYREDIPAINFAQTFFLAPQDSSRGYFVLNDVFRYVNGELTLDEEPERPYSETCTIYMNRLPWNANAAMLHEVFKKFGPLKNRGIQVYGEKGYCSGYVEFEVTNAVQKALEASPVSIGGLPVEVYRLPNCQAKWAPPSKKMDDEDPTWLTGLIFGVSAIDMVLLIYLIALGIRNLP